MQAHSIFSEGCDALLARTDDSWLMDWANRLDKNRYVTYGTGARLFYEGIRANRVALIVSGAVVSNVKDNSGETLSTDFYGPGESPDLVSCLLNEPKMFSATAFTDVQTLEVDKASFEQQVIGNPSFAARVMEALNDAIERREVRLAMYTNLTAQDRIFLLLVYLTDIYKRSGKISLDRVPVTVLADYCVTKPSNLHRILRDLATAGLIEYYNGFVTITGYETLHRIINANAQSQMHTAA